jgi:hypothetical protein
VPRFLAASQDLFSDQHVIGSWFSAGGVDHQVDESAGEACSLCLLEWMAQNLCFGTLSLPAESLPRSTASDPSLSSRQTSMVHDYRSSSPATLVLEKSTSQHREVPDYHRAELLC